MKNVYEFNNKLLMLLHYRGGGCSIIDLTQPFSGAISTV